MSGIHLRCCCSSLLALPPRVFPSVLFSPNTFARLTAVRCRPLYHTCASTSQCRNSHFGFHSLHATPQLHKLTWALCFRVHCSRREVLTSVRPAYQAGLLSRTPAAAHSTGLPLGLSPQPALAPSCLTPPRLPRQLHSSVVCAAKKSAEDLVKRISKDDVAISFARSGGAGGQNVNKVNTKVDLRLNIDAMAWLTEEMKEALRSKEGNRINKDGELVVNSTRTRSQADNLEDAMQKMQSFIDAAALAVQPIEEDPVKKKKLAKQKKKANENRLQEKKLKSAKKSDRRSKIDY